MHIGIVSPEFPPDLGGVETYAYEYSRALSKLGYKVSVFVRRRDQGLSYEEPFKVYPCLQLRKRLDSLTLMKHDKGIDAWHVMNAAQSWLCDYTSKPVIVSVHGNDFLDPYQNIEQLDFGRLPLLWRYKDRLCTADKQIGKWLTRASLRKSLSKATRIITNSRYTEQVLIDKYPACFGRTTAAMVGLGEKFRQIEIGSRAEPDTFQLVTISRLSEPRKNIDLVLAALSKLKNSYQFRYKVIGEGYLKAKLEHQAEKLGLADRVEFSGRVSDQQMIDDLRNGDLFILTSGVTAGSHEGFGIVYLEAAACGTPVLAARLAGAVEAVSEGVSGTFVENASIPELETSLRNFFEREVSYDPGKCQEFARTFSWNDVVERVLPYYESTGIN